MCRVKAANEWAFGEGGVELGPQFKICVVEFPPHLAQTPHPKICIDKCAGVHSRPIKPIGTR